jgi:anti-sigma factor RsiW
MNCEQLRQILYDCLDGSLSPSMRSAAEQHLAGCAACRESVRQESQLAQSLSRRLDQAVETVVLDPVARRGMVRAVERQLAESGERPLFLFWIRLVLPFAAAAMVLLVALWTTHHSGAGRNPLLEAVRPPAPSGNRAVVIHLSCAVPAYTFRQEGNRVIDALTSDTVVADGTLPFEDGESQINQHEL